MELLDLLESRINELLDQLESLKAENAALKDAAALIGGLRAETDELRAALAAEVALREQVAGRLDGLVARLGMELGLGSDSPSVAPCGSDAVEPASTGDSTDAFDRDDELPESLTWTESLRPAGMSQANFGFLSEDEGNGRRAEPAGPGDVRDGTVPA